MQVTLLGLGLAQDDLDVLEHRGHTVDDLAASEGEQEPPLHRPGLGHLLAGLQFLQLLKSRLREILGYHKKLAAFGLLRLRRAKDSLPLALEDVDSELRAPELHDQRRWGGRTGDGGRIADAITGGDGIGSSGGKVHQAIAGCQREDGADYPVKNPGYENR